MTFARQSLGSLLTLLFGLVVSVVLARVLGAEGRGEYQLAVKVAGLVLAFAQWGVPEVLLQLLSERRGQMSLLVGTAFGVTLFGTLVGGLLVFVALPSVGDSLLRGVDARLVWAALAGSLFAMVGLVARRFLQLTGRLAAYNALDVARNALFLGLALVLTVGLARRADGALGAWFGAELAFALVASLYVWRRIAARWRLDRRLGVQMLVAGTPVQAGIVATYLGNEGGAYVLNAGLDVAAVGAYSVALGVARLVLQVATALRTALQPRLVGPEADAALVTGRVARHGIAWMLLLSLGLAVGSPLVPVVFGSSFAAAEPAVLWMLPGMVAYGAMQLLASYLLRVGRRGVLALSSWTFALASIGFQALGASAGGLVGASIGLSLAYLLSAAIVVVAFWRASALPVRLLVPGPAELAFYTALARRVASGWSSAATRAAR